MSIFVDETMNVELLDSISFTSEWVELCSVGVGLKNGKSNIIGVYYYCIILLFKLTSISCPVFFFN